MKHEDLVALAKQAGFNGDERIYDWCYTYHSSREFDDSYKQAFRLDITPEMLKFGQLVYEKAWADTALAATHTVTDAAILKEREACAKVCDALVKATHPNEEQVGPGSCAAAIRARSNP